MHIYVLISLLIRVFLSFQFFLLKKKVDLFRWLLLIGFILTKTKKKIFFLFIQVCVILYKDLKNYCFFRIRKMVNIMKCKRYWNPVSYVCATFRFGRYSFFCYNQIRTIWTWMRKLTNRTI